jgi:hypothetical protein
MTIATDFEAYGAATKRVQATDTSTALTGASGLLAETLPTKCTHLALIPEGAGVHLNFGTASASTTLVPMGGMVFNAENVPLAALELFAAASTYVHVVMGGNSLKTFLGASLSTGDISIGNVGLLNTGEAEVDPATEDKQDDAIAHLANFDLKLGGSKRLTVDTTTQSLQTKWGSSLPANTIAIAIVPESTVAVRAEMGDDATATSSKIADGGEIIPITLADANALELYAASTTYVAVRTYEPRT